MKPRADAVQDGYKIRRVALYPDHSNRARGRLASYTSFAATASTAGLSALRGKDVLWVYNSPATVPLPMWLAKARYKAPIVLHNMDMGPDSVSQTGFGPARTDGFVSRLLDGWVGRMYESATVVAYVSPEAGTELHRRGVPSHKLAYAPVWVDEGVFRPMDGSGPRTALGYTASDIVVGYAGALGKAQGVTRLAQAVAGLPVTSRLKCLIAGSGSEEEGIRQIARTCPERVRYVGQLPHEEAGALTSAFDIAYVSLSAVDSSLYAMPSKITALMACGKPMIGVVDGDAARLLEETRSGFVLSPGDDEALVSLLESGALAKRSLLTTMGEACLKHYREHLSAAMGVDGITRTLSLATRNSRDRGVDA